MRADKQDSCVLVEREDFTGDLESVQCRELDVQQDQIRAESARFLNRFKAVGAFDRVPSAGREHRADLTAPGFVVVDHENTMNQ